MTGIVVSRRDGIATAPDGTKYRVHRGRTLADARHPLVAAWPNDWTPMTVDLTVDGDPSPGAPTPAELEQLRDDLAEAEEAAEDALAQLATIAAGLAERGYELPAEDEREPGWLAGAVLELIPPLAPVAPPPPPRSTKPRAGP